jgi:hypothetical protein
MTMTMRPRHSLEGEVDVDAPIVSKAARSAAHTTVVDSRLGLSEEALTELENPLYVSERADGDWSQSFAFGAFHCCILSIGCILANSQWACRPATSRPCRPASMPGVAQKNCSDWKSFAVASWRSSARRRRRDAGQKRSAFVRRRKKRSGRGRASSRSWTTSEPLHVAPSPRSRSASLFASPLYIPFAPLCSHTKVLFTREVLRTTPAESGEFMAVSRGEVLSVMQELPDGTVVVRRAGSDEKALVRVEVFEP